jgi:DNA replication protein DnaC
MDQTLLDHLSFLELPNLCETWEEVLRDANREKPSYHRFLTTVIASEYQYQTEKRRLSRIRRARIPEVFVMETFPFARQPKLDKRKVMDNYDTKRFLTEAQVLLFIGPTGCGKTGLATSFLVHAINNGYRGRFVDFKDLADTLEQSIGDRSDRSIIRHFAKYDCLLIDELGYSTLDRQLTGLLFHLLKQRHRKHCTIITTQLGFKEWGKLLGDEHLSAALIDRITENCAVFNMASCISIRQKKISHMARQDDQEQD